MLMILRPFCSNVNKKTRRQPWFKEEHIFNMMEKTTLPDISWIPWRIVYIVILFSLSYLLWQLVLLIRREVRLAYWHRKIPAPPLITLMSKIVGAPFFDFYPSIAHFVSVEKCKFAFYFISKSIVDSINSWQFLPRHWMEWIMLTVQTSWELLGFVLAWNATLICFAGKRLNR